MKAHSNTMKGIIWSAMAGVLWGFSGILMQFVSKNEAVPSLWFLSVRTLFAGVALLLIGSVQTHFKIFEMFKNKRTLGRLVSYSLFGLAANMSTFYMSIQTGNAAAATILQYIAPVFIVLVGFIFYHRRPLKTDLLVFLIALVGIFFALTKGDFSQLSIPPVSIVWGLLSAVSAAAYYTLPQPLVKHNSQFVVLGWGTFIAGIFFNCIHPFWIGAPKINIPIVLGIGGVILIGTLGAFSCLLMSLKFASSELISLMDAIEPVATFILSIIFMGLQLNWVEAVGSLMVLYSVFLLQRSRQKLADKNKKNVSKNEL